MYVLVDREQLSALYKHPKWQVLDNLRHIECQQTCAIVPVYGPYGTLTDLELRVLYRNMCGESFYGYHREHLEQVISKMLETLPEAQVNEVEVVVQAMSIADNDASYYRYVFGSAEPSKQNALFRATALQTAPQVLPYTPPVKTPPTVQYVALQAAYNAHKLAREVPCSERPASVANASTYVPPAGGSKTGRVWEIAEPIYQAAVDKTNWKEIRKQVIAACEAEGINSSTASVQYGKFKKSKES